MVTPVIFYHCLIVLFFFLNLHPYFFHYNYLLGKIFSGGILIISIKFTGFGCRRHIFSLTYSALLECLWFLSVSFGLMD